MRITPPNILLGRIPLLSLSVILMNRTIIDIRAVTVLFFGSTISYLYSWLFTASFLQPTFLQLALTEIAQNNHLLLPRWTR